MLDTNMVSYIARRRSLSARTILDELTSPSLACISAITEGEVRYGLAHNPQASAIRGIMQDFLRNVMILPWDSREALTYGTLRAEMKAAGKSLASLDMLIAAHARAVNATLVTSDKAFRHVPGLRTENWATDL